MLQLQKYKWSLDTIRKVGNISLEETSDHWEHNNDLSDYKPLGRTTFNQWKDAIFSQFGKIISCQRTGGYLYFIENHKNIYEDELKKHMLNSYALTNLICENLSLKDKILVSKIPSAYSECKFYYSLAVSHNCLGHFKTSVLSVGSC